MVDIMLSSDPGETSEEHFNPLHIKRQRLGDCEVCGNNAAIYTCPACQVKTCSVPCINIHKKELECNGVRNRVQFKQLHHFTDMDLHSDYSLLEEIGRSVERISKGRRPFQKNMAFKWLKLKNHLWKKGTRLELLPPQFSKHQNNTSYLNWATGIVYWKVEYIFPQAINTSEAANDLIIIDERVDETSLVSELLDKYILKGECTDVDHSKRLKPYIDAGGLSGVKILIKVERTEGNCKYLLINPNLSLSENLEGKLIIEHPSFYVVLSSCIQMYEVVSPDSVKIDQNDADRRDKFQRKSFGRGRGNRRRNRISRNGSMKFFSDNLSDSDGTDK